MLCGRGDRLVPPSLSPEGCELRASCPGVLRCWSWCCSAEGSSLCLCSPGLALAPGLHQDIGMLGRAVVPCSCGVGALQLSGFGAFSGEIYWKKFCCRWVLASPGFWTQALVFLFGKFDAWGFYWCTSCYWGPLRTGKMSRGWASAAIFRRWWTPQAVTVLLYSNLSESCASDLQPPSRCWQGCRGRVWYWIVARVHTWVRSSVGSGEPSDICTPAADPQHLQGSTVSLFSLCAWSGGAQSSRKAVIFFCGRELQPCPGVFSALPAGLGFRSCVVRCSCKNWLWGCCSVLWRCWSVFKVKIS